MEKLQWMFELIDRVSGPSRRIQAALGKMQSAFAKQIAGGTLGRQLAKLPPIFHKGAFKAIQAFHSPIVQGIGGAITRGVGLGISAFGALGSAAMGVGGIIGAAGVGLGAIGAKFAYDSLSFKENSLIALKTLTGTEQAANRIFKEAVRFAAATPFETKDVIANYQKLLVAGFKESELNAVMAGVGDVGAAFGTEKQEQLIGAFRKMKAQGRLTGESLEMLGDAGVKLDIVYAELGKRFNTTAEGARKLISAGKVGANTGVVAALESIRSTISGGELGGMMAAQSETLSGLISSLQSRPFELMIGADASGALKGIKDFVKDLTNALDPNGPVGKRITGMLSIIGEGFGGIFGQATKGRSLETTLMAIMNVLEPIVKAFMAFGKGVMAGFSAAMKPLFDVLTMMGGEGGDATERMTRGMEKLGSALGTVIGLFVNGVVAIGGAIAGAAMWFDYITTKISEFLAWMGNVGGWIIDGIIKGIGAAFPNLAAAISGVGEGIVNIFKGVLGIQSPSKVFEELGFQTARGYDKGLEGSTLDAGFSIPSFSSGSIGGGGVDVGGITINVNVVAANGESAGELSERIAADVRSELTSFFNSSAFASAS